MNDRPPVRPGRRAPWILAAIALAGLAVGAIIATSSPDEPCTNCGEPLSPDVGRAPPTPAPAGPRLFAADSVWNAPLPEDAQPDPSSQALIQGFVAEIGREQEAGIGPWIQTDESSTPLYTVPSDQPTALVHLDDMPEPSYVVLQGAFEEVPLPPDAQPAAGSDGHLTVYQPSTDSLWEFWQLHREADGWHASWGGAMKHVSGSPGYYTADAYPGATSQWGSTATSLPVIGGTIMASELQRGEIDHALAMNIPDARAGVFAWPAQRSDGTGGEELLPEGAKLRLDASLDLTSLHLSPAAMTIVEAAQKYGVIIRDITHHATAFYAEDPTPLGTNPYPEIFENQYPNVVLAGFPWDRLQVMRMKLCTSPPCSSPEHP